MFLVSENYLLQYLINNHQNQKEFYILDVGAGNFQFGRNQAQFINNQINKGILSKDIIVNLISIRGEANSEEPYRNDGYCNLWELGNFKIENLAEEFEVKNQIFDKKLGDLNEKFDLIVSNYTMRHLVDPLGTFLQMHNVTKEGGLILTDTFKFEIKDYNLYDYDGAGILLSYLKDAGDNILVRCGSDDRGFPRIAVEKHSKNIELPFKYNDVSYDSFHNSYCEIFTTIEKPKDNSSSLVYQVMGYNQYRNFAGSKSLFEKITRALLEQANNALTKCSNDLEQSSNVEFLKRKYNDSSYNKKHYSFGEYIVMKPKSILESLTRVCKEFISIEKFLTDPTTNSYKYNFNEYTYIQDSDINLSGNHHDTNLDV